MKKIKILILATLALSGLKLAASSDDGETTLTYYNTNAQEYFKTTASIDMSHVYDLLLSRVPDGGEILDLGCGSGRDSLFFKSRGYRITAADGSEELAKIASSYIGQTVIHMDFSELDFISSFDGIWASCSLLHIDDERLHQIAPLISRSLKTGGFFYASFKFGSGIRTDEKGRLFNDKNFHTIALLEGMFPSMELVHVSKINSSSSARSDIDWIHFVMRKIPHYSQPLNDALPSSDDLSIVQVAEGASELGLSPVYQKLKEVAVKASVKLSEIESSRVKKRTIKGSFSGDYLVSARGRTIGKLVRDNIGRELASEAVEFIVEKIDDADLDRHLFAKLIEEAKEVLSAKDRSSLVEELADLCEVLDCIEARIRRAK